MQNIFLQHKAMQNTLEINNFTKELLETISSFDGSYKLIDNNSLIFKRKTIYDN
jgi:hypothetical protein